MHQSELIMVKATTFPCPRCKKPSLWHDNPARPFCSERCKLIDLGAWANEAYKVADKNLPDDLLDHGLADQHLDDQ